MTKRAVGLDIGSSKTAAFAAHLDEEGRLQIEGLASVSSRGVERGVIVDYQEVGRSVMAALQRVSKETGVDATVVTAGLSGSHLQGHSSQGFVPLFPSGRTVKSEDVLQVINHSRQLVLPAGREQIMALPREFRIDGQRGLSNPVGLGASRLEVISTIVTGLTSALESLDSAVRLAGASMEQIVVHPLASGLGSADTAILEKGAAIVDIGAGVTDLGIFVEGHLAACVCLPVGGNNVTKDLMHLLNSHFEECERLKLEHGCASARMAGEDEVVSVMQTGHDVPRPLKRRVVAEIIESRVRETAQIIGREIDRAGLRDHLGAGIVLTGGGALLPGIEQVFESESRGLKVRVGMPRTHGLNSRKAHSPQFSTAVGLCLAALKATDQEFEPVSGPESWKDRIRTIKSLFGGRP